MQNKVGTLINKLAELHQQQASNANLLTTAHMLVNELQQNVENIPEISSRIAVMLPVNVVPKKVEPINNNTSDFNKSFFGYDIPDVFPVENLTNFAYSENEINTSFPATTSTTPDPMPGIELNDVIAANSEEESLNETLKEKQTELHELLHNQSVNDLCAIIGINDKFLLINELFREDEVMYERSIKTINEFTSLEEAQRWINRELKVRHGWNDDNEISQLFNRLIRRRFSENI